MPVGAVLSQSDALVGSNLPMERATVAPAAVWQALPQVEMLLNHLKMHSCQRSPGPALTSCGRPSGPRKSFGLSHLFLFSPPKQSGTVIALDSKPKSLPTQPPRGRYLSKTFQRLVEDREHLAIFLDLAAEQVQIPNVEGLPRNLTWEASSHHPGCLL